ncbi:MAG: ribonuclease HII, partial [Patescibacteria group bacterium]
MSKKSKKSSPNRDYIVGIDEVGRGALAGPVVVAALALPKNLEFRIKNLAKNLKLPLRDSKKLTSRQREIWFQYIKKLPLSYRIVAVSPKIIDKINISNAANLAASRAVCKLTKNYKLKTKNFKVFLDGGLYLGVLKAKSYKLKAKTVIKGDEKIPAISLASIVAKVSRDRLMKKFHKKYPRYDFVHNVGYGTKKHIKA